MVVRLHNFIYVTDFDRIVKKTFFFKLSEIFGFYVQEA
jgi:hypothetical protein